MARVDRKVDRVVDGRQAKNVRQAQCRTATETESRRVSRLIGINFGEWWACSDVTIEKLYGTQLHDLGAKVTECDARFIPPKTLAVLKPNEFGSPLFTIDGWLQKVALQP